MKKRPELELLGTIAQDAGTSVQYLENTIVHAGFPCPVDAAYQAQPIDLNTELVPHPATTYLMKAAGDSMIEEGIDEGDMLVIDRSLFAASQKVCVVMYDGEFALKHVVEKEDGIYLVPGNKAYAPIRVTKPDELLIWGVVTWVLKKK